MEIFGALWYNGAYRGLAQLVARRVWDAEAAGSSPVTPTISISVMSAFCFAQKRPA